MKFIQHDITKIPKDIFRKAIFNTIVSIIITLCFDILSFFLQFGKEQIEKGNIVIGLILIAVYYVRGVLQSSITIWRAEMQENYRERYNTTIKERVQYVSFVARGKVWVTNKEKELRELMSPSRMMNSCSDYIGNIWDFKTELPRNISDIITTVMMLIGFLMVTRVEVKHTLLFILVLIFTTISYVLCAFRKIEEKNKLKEGRKQVTDARDESKNDLLNIEALNKIHHDYMCDNFIIASKNIHSYKIKEDKKFNKVRLVESLTNSIAILAIFAIKIYETGLENFDLGVILSIISITSIYNHIMNKIYNIINMYVWGKDILGNIKNCKEDFSKVINVLIEQGGNKEKDFGDIESISIPKFFVQYEAISKEKPFKLKNDTSILLKPGDVALLIGPTGGGKTTFIKIATKTIKFDNVEVLYKKKKAGKIIPVIQTANARLGKNSVLSELVFDKEVDEEKLIYILKGLNLYQEISEKSNDVLDYLEKSKATDYSSGQNQRLVIARLLYNMDETIQVIGLDEVTNALNDKIALKTLEFIKKYCKDKIIVMATHQVDIGRTIATQEFEFIASKEYYEVTKK